MTSSPAGQATIAAFVSPSGGVGRTGIVANLAWILAGAGHRVLVIDLGTEDPRVGAFLRPFFVDRLTFGDVFGPGFSEIYFDVPEVLDEAELQLVARHAMPNGTGRIDVISTPAATRDAERTGSKLRSRLLSGDHEYVLVDAPTGSAEPWLSVMATVPDVVLVCFLARLRKLDEGAKLGATIKERSPFDLDVLPVATMFEDRYALRAEQLRGSIRGHFADLAARATRGPDTGVLEVPYQPYDAYEELLVALVEDPVSDQTGLSAAYGRLAAAITRGQVSGIPPVPAMIRTRYRRSLGLETEFEPEHMVIAYAAADRPWAEWISRRLQAVGCATRPLSQAGDWFGTAPSPNLLVVESAAFARSEDAQRVAAVMDQAADVTWWRIGDVPDPVARQGMTIRASLTEEQSRTRLLAHFGLLLAPERDGPDRIRFPVDQPNVTNVQSRGAEFVGRDDELERLRDRFTTSTERPAVVRLAGPPGIGKSWLAEEYATRFAFDYDVVWWIPAYDRQSVLTGLTGLARALQITRAGDATDVLHALAQPTGNTRWLLVYDNAESTDVVDGLWPEYGDGHVLVTVGGIENGTGPNDLVLSGLSARQSAGMLADRVPALPMPLAQDLADAVRHIPLALDHTAAWVRETIATLRLHGVDTTSAARRAAETFLALVEQSGAEDPYRTVARVVTAQVSVLANDPLGRTAVLLAELCSFLSPAGIDLRLLRSKPMVRALVTAGGAGAEGLARDAAEIDRVLWKAARYGLFRVQWGRKPRLYIHRVVQNVLRDRMDDGQRTDRRTAVVRALSEYAPSEVEDSLLESRGRYAELQNHLSFCGVLTSGDDVARRWLVNQIRHLTVEGGSNRWQATRDLAVSLHERWAELFGPEDEFVLRLAVQIANLHRSLGQYAAAAQLGHETLAKFGTILPADHPWRLIAARGLAGDLRGLGAFRDALEQDQASWQGFRDALGDDHVHTRRAANNLALSMFLSGNVAEALRIEQDNHARRRRLFGEQDVFTWVSLGNVGVYQRELGGYAAALDSLRQARENLTRLRPENHPDILRVQLSYAITERLQGRIVSALERNGYTLRAYRAGLGPAHPDTVRCALSLSAARRLAGDVAIAVSLAEECLDTYRGPIGLSPDHPFVAVAQAVLGSALVDDDQPAKALEMTRQGWTALRRGLTDAHPWTLAAAINHGAILWRLGHTSEAKELMAAGHRDCVEFLGRDHPYSRAADHNLRMLLAEDMTAGHLRIVDVDVPQT